MSAVGRIQGIGVNRRYASNGRTATILDAAEFEFAAGSFSAVVGRSGIGKSTFLNLIGGLDRPDSGQVLVDGRHIEAMSDAELSRFRNETVGFVFQTFFLRQMRTAADNVMVPLIFASEKIRTARERAKLALETVGLGAFVKAPVKDLSGGQRQRVAIARAIVNRPKILLADEPTGNLDTATSLEIFELLLRLNRESGTTIVIVTHDPLVEQFEIPKFSIDGGKLVKFTDRI